MIVHVYMYMYMQPWELDSPVCWSLLVVLQTYSITVEHASKSEISVLKNKGVVGGKAGRCALFRARDVCRMFNHWNTVPPQPFRELAEGKVNTIVWFYFV